MNLPQLCDAATAAINNGDSPETLRNLAGFMKEHKAPEIVLQTIEEHAEALEHVESLKEQVKDAKDRLGATSSTAIQQIALTKNPDLVEQARRKGGGK